LQFFPGNVGRQEEKFLQTNVLNIENFKRWFSSEADEHPQFFSVESSGVKL